MGQSDLGEALQKWEAAKPCQKGLLLVEGYPEISFKL